jgi:hypothetical protein
MQFPEDKLIHLQDSLTLADLVKFAKQVPLGDENEKCFSNILTFVHETKPQEVEAISHKEEDKPDNV